MKLKDLGFNDWFKKEAEKSQDREYSLARVTAVDKNQFDIRNEKTTVVAEITGKLIYEATSKTDFPTVGDWVRVQYFNEETLAIIHSILPRKSLLKRKIAGTTCLLYTSDAADDLLCVD